MNIIKSHSRSFFIIISLAIFASGSPSNAANLESINIYGYFDLEYCQTTGNRFYKSGPEDPNLKNGAFDQRHMNILADIAVDSRIALKTHIEFEHGIHPSADSASVIMEYGFAEYTFGDALKIRAGKMLTPYGLYSEMHDATPAYLTTSPPDTFYRAEFYGGAMLMPKWSTGLAVMGELSIFSTLHNVDYVIYVGNGESRFTTNTSEQDDNPNKAVGGRVQFVSENEFLILGVSGFIGDRAFTTDELRVSHVSFAGHASVSFSGMNITSEFGRSVLGRVTEETWYVQASMRFGRVTPYVRYQFLNPDSSLPDDAWMITLGGVNIMMTDALALKVEWNDNRRGIRNLDIISGEDKNFGEFRAALTLMF